MSKQLLVLTGNLGRDPEMRYTQGGTPVTSFSVATNEKWTDQDGQRQERTAWFRVSAWGRQADACSQYLHKGSLVQVIGRLNPDPETGGPRVYTRNDGAPGASYEVTAREVVFLGSSGGGPRDEDVPPEADF
jgi:single-strand DNA-binding protein